MPLLRVSCLPCSAYAPCCAHTLGFGQQVMPEIKASGEEQPTAGGGSGIAEASGMQSLLTASSVDETGT